MRRVVVRSCKGKSVDGRVGVHGHGKGRRDVFGQNTPVGFDEGNMFGRNEGGRARP